MLKKLKGKISIGKVSCSDQDDYMRIQITDDSSSIQVIEIEMSLLTFAMAITGSGYLDVDYKLSKTDNLGKKLEVKHAEITLGENDDWVEVDDQAIRKAIAKFEVDGWMGCDSDAKNWHNHVARVGAPANTFRISFHRYGLNRDVLSSCGENTS